MSDELAGKRIAVLKGGPGSERTVSLATAAGVENALREIGAEVIGVDVCDEHFTLPENMDFAFNAIHGTLGEDGELQRILDARGVIYTGEGERGSRLAFDKIETKQRFVECGIPTAEFEIFANGELGKRPALPLPYVVKAPREGSSVGIYIVKSEAEIDGALREASRLANRLLIEEYVEGRELTVGVLGDLALPIIEILPKEGFYDFNNKYPFLNPQADKTKGANGTNGGATHFCPAPLDEALTKKVQEMALAAHRALGLETYSRVDFLLTESGRLVVLEINTIPGMTPTSLLPEAAKAAGIGYAELCLRIIDLSKNKRNKRRRKE